MGLSVCVTIAWRGDVAEAREMWTTFYGPAHSMRGGLRTVVTKGKDSFSLSSQGQTVACSIRRPIVLYAQRIHVCAIC